MTGSTAVTYSRSETFPSIRIPVFRAGPAAGTTSVTYTLGAPSDTATLGVDYTDASLTPGTLSFGDGERVKAIPISIQNDQQTEGSEIFQVALTGAQAVDPKTTTVTIIDNDSDDIAPKSWFHHPRHGRTYRHGDYRLREMHVFFSDEGGSEVVSVEMALRKKRLNGSCAWWVSGGWQGGPCSSKRWMPMKFDFDLYLKRFRKALAPSVGTKIRNYTAWCRATDGAGNVQTSFLHDRKGTRAKGDGNWSTFEVKKG
ncbi:MAG: Calx-beta domain-containing protein [Actinomycetota bacterium]